MRWLIALGVTIVLVNVIEIESQGKNSYILFERILKFIGGVLLQ